MHVSLVLTVLGPDRPGVVEELASLLAAHQGNWLESRMGRLGGEFAGILRCGIAADRQAAFVAALEKWARNGFAVSVKPDPGRPPVAGLIAWLELLGQDRPGIVREVSAALARHRVNVEELETCCRSAPMSGETLFEARARVWIPPGGDAAALQRELEQIAADLQVDLSFKAVTEEMQPQGCPP